MEVTFKSGQTPNEGVVVVCLFENNQHTEASMSWDKKTGGSITCFGSQRF